MNIYKELVIHKYNKIWKCKKNFNLFSNFKLFILLLFLGFSTLIVLKIRCLLKFLEAVNFLYDGKY